MGVTLPSHSTTTLLGIVLYDPQIRHMNRISTWIRIPSVSRLLSPVTNIRTLYDWAFSHHFLQPISTTHGWKTYSNACYFDVCRYLQTAMQWNYLLKGLKYLQGNVTFGSRWNPWPPRGAQASLRIIDWVFMNKRKSSNYSDHNQLYRTTLTPKSVNVLYPLEIPLVERSDVWGSTTNVLRFMEEVDTPSTMKFQSSSIPENCKLCTYKFYSNYNIAYSLGKICWKIRPTWKKLWREGPIKDKTDRWFLQASLKITCWIGPSHQEMSCQSKLGLQIHTWPQKRKCHIPSPPSYGKVWVVWDS